MVSITEYPDLENHGNNNMAMGRYSFLVLYCLLIKSSSYLKEVFVSLSFFDCYGSHIIYVQSEEQYKMKNSM